MGQKNKKKFKENKQNKVKYSPIFRTKEERILETKPIIEKLSEMNLTLENTPELINLFSLIKIYINDDEKIDINIPCPSINKTIKGVLSRNIREEVCVKLVSEKY